MFSKKNIGALSSPLFIISLVMLLFNDFYLKYKFPGLITGKLSDFSGLFIFPLFFSVFFPKLKVKIYFTTAFIFVFWKLPVSDGFLNFINLNNYLFFQRVVDPTDLIAILILPFSYVYLNRQLLVQNNFSRYGIYFVSFISVVAFCATSVDRHYSPNKMSIKRTFKFKLPKEFLIDKYLNKSVGNSFDEGDSLYYVSFEQKDDHRARLKYLVAIKQLPMDTTIILVDSLLEYGVDGKFLFGSYEDSKVYFKSLSKNKYDLFFCQKLLELTTAKKESYTLITFRSKTYADSSKFWHYRQRYYREHPGKENGK